MPSSNAPMAANPAALTRLPAVVHRTIACQLTGKAGVPRRLRAAVTPARRGMGVPQRSVTEGEPPAPPLPRHVAMSWARRGPGAAALARTGGSKARDRPAERVA